jgi:hypothetical protein
MRRDVPLGGVGAGVAAQGHVGVLLVLVHADVCDLHLRRQGGTEAGVEPALARLRLAVVVHAAWGRIGEPPRGGDRGVQDHVGRLIGDLGLKRVQPGLLYAKAELIVCVPVHVTAVLPWLPLQAEGMHLLEMRYIELKHR